jgi:predicted Rossmann fold flavoprotein
MKSDNKFDAIIIGAGAAGLFCAIEAGKRGRSVLLLDHASKAGEKIRISGGGRCNFTNMHTTYKNFLSKNSHFCKSALKKFDHWSFIDLVQGHKIAYHEKTLGQLFCDGKSTEIIEMLVGECRKAKVELSLNTSVSAVTQTADGFALKTTGGSYSSKSLVVACGGKSIPKMGATGFGYSLAEQFGHRVLTTRAGLVPLTFTDSLLERCKALAGLSVDAIVSFGKTSFREGLLFTHRGLSGPSILQISSYWKEGQEIEINLAPDADIVSVLLETKATNGKSEAVTLLSRHLPRRLAEQLITVHRCEGRLADQTDKTLCTLGDAVNRWKILPSGTEGYRTAEVTLGGVDTDQLSSKTMESKLAPGLFFIGEVVDVTGHLGGFNFQWAWSSGWVAGQNA